MGRGALRNPVSDRVSGPYELRRSPGVQIFVRRPATRKRAEANSPRAPFFGGLSCARSLQLPKGFRSAPSGTTTRLAECKSLTGEGDEYLRYARIEYPFAIAPLKSPKMQTARLPSAGPDPVKEDQITLIFWSVFVDQVKSDEASKMLLAPVLRGRR